MTHHFLYWLGTSWWCLGLALASLLCMSKTCLLLMHLQWSRGSSAHSAALLWLFMAWTILWFPVLYGPLPLRTKLCWIVGLFSFSLLFHSCSLATISCRTQYHSAIPIVMSFDPSLLGLFGPIAYSSSNYSIWSLGFLLYCLWAPAFHLFPLGHLWPICFP